MEGTATGVPRSREVLEPPEFKAEQFSVYRSYNKAIVHEKYPGEAPYIICHFEMISNMFHTSFFFRSRSDFRTFRR